MRVFLPVYVSVPLAALCVLACGEECQEPPGTFQPVEGCVLDLEAGEDVYPFCANRPGSSCGGPDDAFAQSWLAGLQAMAEGPDDPQFPIRVGCGPFNPELLIDRSSGDAAADCCFLMVYAESGEENCVDTSYLQQ